MASGTFSISATFAGSVTLPTGGVWSTTTDAPNNRSFLTAQYSVRKDSGFTSTGGTGTFGINVDGVAYQTTKSITIPGGTTVLVYTTPTITINHNTNGTKSVAISVFGSIPTTTWTSTTGSTTAVLDDYDRSPVFSDSTVAPTARVGIAYSDGVSASNTSSYSVFSGALPPGLSLNTSTGAITGTPTVAGVYNFVIRATGSFEGTKDTGTLTITVSSVIRVWNGSSFAFGLPKVWGGSSFVDGRVRVWNGSAWIDAKG
jgi:hypothetical protein